MGSELKLLPFGLKDSSAMTDPNIAPAPPDSNGDSNPRGTTTGPVTAPGDRVMSVNHVASQAEELLPIVYEELRKLAAHQMADRLPGDTLQPTALVHEAWLRLGRNPERQWNDRTHFFAAAAQAMRQILVDRARRKQRVRHGGQLERVDLDQMVMAATDDPEAVLRVHEALTRLASLAPDQARLVELRYFCGLTIEESAAALDVSTATAKRHWVFARAWLFNELRS